MKPLLIILMFLFSGSIANANPEEDSKNYLSITGSFIALQDAALEKDLEGAEIKFDSGFGLDLGFGRKINPFGWKYGGLRVEGEYGYREVAMFHIDSPTGHDVLEQDIGIKTLMGNLYYDLKLKKGKLSPYIGAGAGYAWLKDGEGWWDDNAFAYQAMAGITYKINPTISLIAGYKYFATAKFEGVYETYDTGQRLGNPDGSSKRVDGRRQYRIKHTSMTGPEGVYPVEAETNIQSHNFQLGLRFAF